MSQNFFSRLHLLYEVLALGLDLSRVVISSIRGRLPVHLLRNIFFSVRTKTIRIKYAPQPSKNGPHPGCLINTCCCKLLHPAKGNVLVYRVGKW